MMPDYPKPPFASQKQPMPGMTDAMQPQPDHGEKSYKGCGRLKGLKAVITGGDSGIGRAVAIAVHLSRSSKLMLRGRHPVAGL